MTPYATVKTRGFLLTGRRYDVFQRITRRRVFEYDRMILRLVPPIELSPLRLNFRIMTYEDVTPIPLTTMFIK